MHRPTVGLAMTLMLASAAPVLAQEPPAYLGSYNPPVVRTGHDSKIGSAAVGGHRGMHDVSDRKIDVAPGGYAANIITSDIYSGK